MFHKYLFSFKFSLSFLTFRFCVVSKEYTRGSHRPVLLWQQPSAHAVTQNTYTRRWELSVIIQNLNWTSWFIILLLSRQSIEAASCQKPGFRGKYHIAIWGRVETQVRYEMCYIPERNKVFDMVWRDRCHCSAEWKLSFVLTMCNKRLRIWPRPCENVILLQQYFERKKIGFSNLGEIGI